MQHMHLRQRIFRPFIAIALICSVLASIVTAIPPTMPAGAQESPVGLMSRSCVVGTASGTDVAGIGETVSLTSAAAFAPGTIYQDSLHRPDGAMFYASYVQLTPAATYLAPQ